MAITLAQAKVGMADHVDQQVIDSFRRSSLLLDLMTFDNSVSPGTGGSTLVYGYIQLLTPSTAAARAINSEYTADEAIRTKKTANLIPMGGSFQIDRVLQNTSGAIDEVAFQAEQKIRATANYFHNLCVNGSAAASGAGYVTSTFDGLKKTLTGTAQALTSTADLTTSANMTTNMNAFLDELDALYGAVEGGPSIFLMNDKMLGKVRSVARRAGYYRNERDEFGRVVEYYRDAPLFDAGKIVSVSGSTVTTADVVADVAATSSAAGTSSIYAVGLGLDGFHGVTVAGDKIMSMYLPDMTQPGAVKTGEVEFVAGAVLKSLSKAAVLTGIATTPATGN